MPAIIFAESSVNMGGQEYQILTQMAEFTRRGWETYLICKKISKIGEQAKKNGFQVRFLPLRNALDLKSIFSLLLFLIKVKPIGIILHSGHDSIIGAIASKIYRCIYKNKIKIIRARTYQPGVPGSFPYNNLFDITIAPSQYLRNEILKNIQIKSSKVITLYPGIDFNKLQNEGSKLLDPKIKEWHQKTPGLLIVHGAMLRGEKGHLQFLNVFSKLLIKFPTLKYVIAGDGPEKNTITEKIKKLNLTNQVFIAGIVSPIAPLIRMADIAILPSHREPLGMFQIESQYFQIPTLATEVDGIPETIEHQKTGLLTKDTEEEWRNAIEWAILNQKRMKGYAVAGKIFVEEKFSIKKNIDAIIELIKN
jgi:glycosyltransferase involved in cell wall biosynthesis